MGTHTIKDNQLRFSPLHFVILAFLFLLGLAIRMARYADAYYKDDLLFLGADTWYHMRRIHLAVMNWPDLLHFDSYLDFPSGAGVVLPPGFDSVLATAGYILSGFKYSPSVVDLVSAAAPPFLGALTVIVIYFVGKALFNSESGLWASFLYTFLFGGIWISLFGKPDHHVMESLLTPVLFLILHNRFVKPGGLGKHHGAGTILFSAIFLSVCQLMWRGAIIYITMLVFFTGIYLLCLQLKDLDHVRLTLGNKLLVLGLSVIFMSLFISPWCLGSFYGQRKEIVYFALSLFHPLFYFSGGLSIVTLAFLVSGYSHMRRASVRRSLHVLVPGVVFLVISLSGLLYLTQEALEGVRYLGKSDLWMQTINETQPLFSGSFKEAFDRASIYFGFWWILFLPILGFLIYEKRSGSRQFFLMWCLINLVLVLKQVRYNHQLTVVLVLSSGYVLSSVRRFVHIRLDKTRTPGAASVISVLLILLTILIVSLPSLHNLQGFIETRYDREHALPLNLYETFLWMRENTSVPGDYMNPTSKPDYGVMSLWDYGNWIVSLAERPVIASNFGFLHKGLVASCQALLTTSYSDLNRIMEENRARYLLLGNFRNRNNQMRMILEAENTFTDLTTESDTPLSEVIYWRDGAIPSRYYNKNLTRGCYRLVYESPPNPAPQFFGEDVFKVFEYVPGVQLVIKGRESTDWRVTFSVVRPSGRRFTTGWKGTTDETGKSLVLLPYPTVEEGAGGQGHSPYTVICNNTHFSLDISSRDINSNKQVVVQCQ